MPKQIKTTLRLPEDKHRAFLMAMAERGDKAQRVLEAAVDEYLSTPPPKDKRKA